MFPDSTSVNMVKAEQGEVESVFTSAETKKEPVAAKVEKKPKKRRTRGPAKKVKEDNSGDE